MINRKLDITALSKYEIVFYLRITANNVEKISAHSPDFWNFF